MGFILHVVEDCLGILQLYSDGSISRTSDNQSDFDNFPIKDDGSVLWKDSLYDDEKDNQLYLHLYKPVKCSANKKLLPIIYFFHGGGFCVGSRTWPNCHNCCLHLSSALQALVIAPDYRLAPEHRLPAAMDDAFASTKWLQNQQNTKTSILLEPKWSIGHSASMFLAFKAFIALSAGQIVKYRIGVMEVGLFQLSNVSPMSSEDVTLNSSNIPSKRFWRLSLPIGATADHPLANPFGPLSSKLKPMKLDLLLVIVGGNELLKDRVEDYASKLKELNKDFHYFEFEGMQHGFFTNDPFSQVANLVLQEIKYFMCRTSC
ncbi:hypothetical protein RND71_005717 [Anisodus tanguticus]|uniref:Alpha/beta hydrolase fold-3 domain-containing protein n=1 Tax=Anisodus tanguticus TaxID=243964 RepID=A0AAE1VVP9_9SOLA|nr:hypothetical protein RND71_005717 [Anisodus tanguticus]